MPEIDTDYTDNITCPYCGHEILVSWEIQRNRFEFERVSVECEECEKEFFASRDCDITYSTMKKEEQNE